MLKNKSIAVVVPAYNEELQIGMVIETMPDFVDRIVIVNDYSKDRTAEIVKSYQGKYDKVELPDKKVIHKKDIYSRANEVVEEWNRKEIKYFAPTEVYHPVPDEKIVLLDLLENVGVGGAIARGYKWAKDNNIDCTAVMAGDAQMDPEELYGICLPVVEQGVDYVKGNRLSHKSARVLIPKTRFFGNSILSILTKIASGYWHISDTQTGYTAMSNRVLNLIDLYKIYPRYGMPNDLLVKLNIVNGTLKEIPIKPIYDVGEQSKMKISKVIPKISWLLFRSFFHRIWKKYLFISFHPLFILYNFGILLMLISIPFGVKILIRVIERSDVNPVTALAFAFLFISGFQSLLFAMWMDIQDNERLNM
jgi:glycosyltransferase involved in cell wall biosynthesis